VAQLGRIPLETPRFTGDADAHSCCEKSLIGNCVGGILCTSARAAGVNFLACGLSEPAVRSTKAFSFNAGPGHARKLSRLSGIRGEGSSTGRKLATTGVGVNQYWVAVPLNLGISNLYRHDGIRLVEV
jgi:hypothetical protein